MLKPPDHDARRNTNFSGKCLDRRLAEIYFKGDKENEDRGRILRNYR